MIQDSTSTKQNLGDRNHFKHLHAHSIPSPPAMRSKRRYTEDDEDEVQNQFLNNSNNNKSRFQQRQRYQYNDTTTTPPPINVGTGSNNHENNDSTDQEYPKFHHPEGGFIQFTPQGTLRTYIGPDNVEVSELQPSGENNKFDLGNVNHGIDGYKLNHNDVSVESYMSRGYSDFGNGSSSVQDYYSYDCDSDLEDEDEDFQMI